MNLDELVNRPRMYAGEDGVGELAIGLTLALTVEWFRLSTFLPLPLHLFVPQAGWLCISFGIFWGAKKLKEQVTSPRGGYVALDEPSVTIRGRRIAPPLFRVALVAALGLFFIALSNVFTSPPAKAAAFSAIFSGGYAFGAIKYRMPGMVWLAAFSALIGVWANARNGDLAFVLFWQGAALAVYGGFRFWRFMKSHPRPIASEA